MDNNNAQRELFSQQIFDNIKGICPNARYEEVGLDNLSIFVVSLPKKSCRTFYAYALSDNDYVQVGEICITRTTHKGLINVFETAFDYQGLGIGRTLMNCAKSCYAHQGIGHIELVVAPTSDMQDSDGSVIDYCDQYSKLVEVYTHLGYKLLDYEKTQLPPTDSTPIISAINMSCDYDINKTIEESLFDKDFYLMTPVVPVQDE